jgi:hypothetical protein
VALITVACIAGTLIPQGGQVSRFLASHPDAPAGWRFVEAVGLTRVFSSWWFALMLCLLAASLMVCTGRRCRAIRGATGLARLRVVGSFITHISLLLILAGAVVRVVWGEKGMLELMEGQTATSCRGQTGVMTLPFAIRLVDFELEYYETDGSKDIGTLLVQWPEKMLALTIPVELMKETLVAPPDEVGPSVNTYRVKAVRYLPDFKVDPATREIGSRSDQPNNPALLVSVAGSGGTTMQWVFANYPDFSGHGGRAGGRGMPLQFRFQGNGGGGPMGRGTGPVKAYLSKVELIEDGKVIMKKTIAMNSPLSYRGYTIYQVSYRPHDLRWTELQVVRDPGVPLVYAGFILMMIGVSVVVGVGPFIARRPKVAEEAV